MPIVLATGNDFRAKLKAGAHAYAAKNGNTQAVYTLPQYRKMRYFNFRLEIRLALEVGGLTTLPSLRVKPSLGNITKLPMRKN